MSIITKDGKSMMTFIIDLRDSWQKRTEGVYRTRFIIITVIGKMISNGEGSKFQHQIKRK